MVIIVKVAADRVEIHRIDGKVSAGGIFILLAENVVVGNDAVLVFCHALLSKAAESRHFNRLGALVDMNKAESSSDNDGASCDFFDFFRGRIGGDIKVFRFGSDQQISYGAADNKSFISGILKLLADGYCKRAHGQEVNSVFFSRNNMSFLPNFCRHIRFEALVFFYQLSHSVRTEAFRTAYVR